tara:strand:- start:1227 stop:1676 length:450 start_codon:yes stop_codon:yes gene_type:complete
MANYLNISEKSSEQGQGRLPKLRGQIAPTSTLTSNTTLYDYNSGTTYFLDGSSAFDVTLPSAKAGVNFKFIITDVTADVDVVQAAATEDFVGTISTGAGGSDSAVSGDTKIIFDESGGAVVGDQVSLECDGTNWYVKGACDAAGGVVFG